jgi:hypothetical protein
MFIGGAPIGCVALGELAERFGISTALRGYSGCGLVMLVAWLCVRPQALWILRG